MEEFVRSSVKNCLKIVNTRLRKLTKSPKDLEEVHRLRIAIRKTLAVLHTFAQFWDSHQAGDLETRLHRIGRLCGKARDCDVALRLLEEVGAYASQVVEKVKDERKRRRRKIGVALQDWNCLLYTSDAADE